MRKRNQLFMLLAGLGAASGLVLTSCNDLTTGQDGEPEGPLKVTRVTLFDASRDHPVFTDTSAPADCSISPAKETDRCENDPFKDQYGVKRSPPPPSALDDIRIVFNKLPLTVDGQDIQKISKTPMMPPVEKDFGSIDKTLATLSCVSGCDGAPATIVQLALTGSELSPDPTVFPYGPALQIIGDPEDPKAALEPGSEYSVVLKPGLGDRAGNKLEMPAMGLLRFTTEPFQILQVGVGDPDNDPYVYAEPSTAFEVADVADDGVIAIRLNAPVDPAVFSNATVTAKMGADNVPVKIGVNQITEVEDDMMMSKLVCDPGNQRTLYIYPADHTSWGGKEGEVTITIKGAEIRDLSQRAGHPEKAGKHGLTGDLVVKATLTGKPADADYSGLTVDTVAAPSDCPGAMMSEDMSMAVDMSIQG